MKFNLSAVFYYFLEGFVWCIKLGLLTGFSDVNGICCTSGPRNIVIRMGLLPRHLFSAGL